MDDDRVDLDSPAPRPELRRAPRFERMVYRLGLDIDGAAPAIWRRIDVRGDAPLDVLHQVVQAAFGWDDAHLYRFALGGGPFDPDSQLFLCPFDVDDPDVEEVGVPAWEVRLDETLRQPGDVLRYVYDYGDFWELTIELEAVQPLTEVSSVARLVDGERAVPPEDCGGLTDGGQLAEVLDDPARFDSDAVDDALRGPFFELRGAGVDRRMADLVLRLRQTPAGDALARRAHLLATEPTSLDDADLAAHLAAHQWFLDRGTGGGLPMTAAGYLKPDIAAQAAKVVPQMGDWPGTDRREANCPPLLRFRQSLQKLGLMRHYKGAFVTTKAGAAAQRDPAALWNHLAARLLPDPEDDAFTVQATMVFLAYAGSCGEDELPFKEMAAALNDLGWRRTNGSMVDRHELHQTSAHRVLRNVSARPSSFSRHNHLSRGAAALARAALRRTDWGSLPIR